MSSHRTAAGVPSGVEWRRAAGDGRSGEGVASARRRDVGGTLRLVGTSRFSPATRAIVIGVVGLVVLGVLALVLPRHRPTRTPAPHPVASSSTTTSAVGRAVGAGPDYVAGVL